LMAERKQAQSAKAVAPAAGAAGKKAPPARARPVVPPGIPQRFWPVRETLAEDERLVYRPALLGEATLHFVKARTDLDRWEEDRLLVPLGKGSFPDPWADADVLDADAEALELEGDEPAEFASLPPHGSKAKSYKRWGRTLKAYLYRTRTTSLWKCASLKQTSKPGESEGEFRSRLSFAVREKRDLQVEKLRKRFTPKLARIQERIRKAEARVEREQDQYKQQKLQSAVSIGSTLLGALFGRRMTSVGNVSRASRAVGRMGRASKERGDIVQHLLSERAQTLRRVLEDVLALGTGRVDALDSARREAAEQTLDALVTRYGYSPESAREAIQTFLSDEAS